MPQAPEALLESPRDFQYLPKDRPVTTEEVLELMLQNYDTAIKNRIQLDAVQSWIKEQSKIYPPH